MSDVSHTVRHIGARIVLPRQAVDVLALSGQALRQGGIVVPMNNPADTGTVVEWDIAARCTRPINIAHRGECHHAVGFTARKGVGVDWYGNRTLETLVPCRECKACLRARADLWGRRAVTEYKAATRSWFGTLTFSAENRYRLQCLTDLRLQAEAQSLSGLVPVDRFRELHRECGPIVTRYLKRLRKGNAGAEFPPTHFRYLLTVEPHKDWTPHYHLLVCEVLEIQPVRKRALEIQWSQGFARWRLVKDERAAFYVAKYLNKNAVARVRASKRFGESAS